MTIYPTSQQDSSPRDSYSSWLQPSSRAGAAWLSDSDDSGDEQPSQQGEYKLHPLYTLYPRQLHVFLYRLANVGLAQACLTGCADKELSSLALSL